MPDSTRQDILDGLNTRIDAIAVADGYRRTITTIAYEAKDWGEVDSTLRDWCGIVPQSETNEDYPGHVQTTWFIDLIFHLTPSAATAAAVLGAIVDMKTDLRRTLYSSPSNLAVDGVHFVKIASSSGTEADPEAVAQGVATLVAKLEIEFEESNTAT